MSYWLFRRPVATASHQSQTCLSLVAAQRTITGSRDLVAAIIVLFLNALPASISPAAKESSSVVTMSSSKEEIKKINSVKWSSDNILVFLDVYNNNYELLWNVRHQDYVNKSKRESAMIKLKIELLELGIPVPDLGFLRARIKSIKSTYRTELLKVNESKTSGAGSDEVYEPKLPWYSAADAFMRDVIITRKSTSNLVSLIFFHYK